MQTLTELQAVDLDAAGLGDFKRPESLASRQLRRWTRQWEASKTAELPTIEEVAELLAARMPEERESVLVHGDYRLDNAVVSEDGEVRAVLDWELCTVGDPLADVGLLVAYWNELGAAAASRARCSGSRSPRSPASPTGAELAAEYARRPGGTSRSSASGSRSPTGRWRSSSRASTAAGSTTRQRLRRRRAPARRSRVSRDSHALALDSRPAER